MYLYLDTSSLVKLYVQEADSELILRLVRECEVAATSLIAYAESRAAFARRLRERAFSAEGYGRLITGFEKDWGEYLQVLVSPVLVRRAGELAETHGLRGFDALHLASALTLQRELKAPVVFSSADARLQRAAADENLKTES